MRRRGSELFRSLTSWGWAAVLFSAALFALAIFVTFKGQY